MVFIAMLVPIAVFAVLTGVAVELLLVLSPALQLLPDSDQGTLGL